jgi:hypothetical protein
MDGRDGKGGEEEYVRAIKKAAERNYRARRRGWRPGPVAAGMPSSAEGRGEEVCTGSGVGEGVVGLEGFEAEMMGGGDGGLGVGGEGREGVVFASDQELGLGWEMGADAGQLMFWDGDLDMEAQGLGMGEWDFSMSSSNGVPLSLKPKAQEDEEEVAGGGKMMPPSRAESYSLPRFSTKAELVSQPLTRLSSIRHSRSYSARALPLSSLWYDSSFPATYSVRSSAELDLLMHYLDNVFCLQYGFSCLKNSCTDPSRAKLTYSDTMGSGCMGSQTSLASDGSVSHGPLDRGRGWYLSTLLKCRPLYFATLSISAWHQHLVRAGDVAAVWAPAGGTSGEGKVGCKIEPNLEAEKNFAMALKGLQGVIDEFQRQGLTGLELLRVRWMVLGTMCQVLSLEVRLYFVIPKLTRNP